MTSGIVEPHDVVLTATQEAALARLVWAATGAAATVAEGGGMVLLCGPAGVGKTTVLERLAAARPGGRTAEVRPLAAWLEVAALPDIVVADDAHEADAVMLADVVSSCRSRAPAAGIVLAGEGRLLTIVTRDPRIERLAGLRAILRPCTLAETRDLLARHGRHCEAVAETIHELSGGIPAVIVRVAALAGILVAGRAGARLEPADIELLHRRLTLAAA